jgi:hypothetical protein
VSSEPHNVRVVLDLDLSGNSQATVCLTGSGIVEESDVPVLRWAREDDPRRKEDDYRTIDTYRTGHELDDQETRSVGDLVAALLFPGRIRLNLLQLLGESAKRLVFVLNLHDQHLAAVPWELVRVEGNFLLREGHTLVRRARWMPHPVDSTSEVCDVHRRLLLVRGADEKRMALPHGEDDLLLSETRESAQDFEVELLDAPNPGTLKSELDRIRPGIIHFAGHGVEKGGAVLLGDDKQLRSSTLVELLKGQDARLVLLSVCRSANWLSRGEPVGLATECIEQYVPAVVAMRTDVLDREARLFTSALYSGLTKGIAIEWCMVSARNFMEGHWSSAVLYLSAESFAFADAQMELQPPAMRWVQVDSAQGSRLLLVGAEGPLVVEAGEGYPAEQARGTGRIASSQDGRALVWQRGDALRCAWLGELHGNIRIWEWSEQTESLSRVVNEEFILLAATRRGDLAVESVVSTENATLSVRYHRREGLSIRAINEGSSIAAAFVGSTPCTVDANGKVRDPALSELLASYEPIRSLDSVSRGDRSLVVAIGEKLGNPVVVGCELPGGRITEIDSSPDTVAIERNLGDFRKRFKVVLVSGATATRHLIG